MIEETNNSFQENSQVQNQNNSEDDKLRILQRNIPLFYDYFVGHTLEWPTLTCQYLPDLTKINESNYIKQKVILGTQSEERNYLYIAKLTLPNPQSKSIKDKNYRIIQKENSYIKKGSNALNLETKINHPGEVIKARASYNSYNIIATKNNEGQVFIFDYSKHGFNPKSEISNPQMMLFGHETDGWGLDWSLTEHYLTSCDDDGIICFWDLQKSPQLQEDKTQFQNCLNLQCLFKNKFSESSINEIKFHKFSNEILGFVTGQKFCMMDTSVSNSQSQLEIQTKSSELFCLDFNWQSEYLVLMGGANGVLVLYDIRNTQQCLHDFTSDDQKEYLRADWSPLNKETFFATGSHSIIDFYDCTKLEQNNGLIFKHYHHDGQVNDVNWNPQEPLSINQ